MNQNLWGPSKAEKSIFGKSDMQGFGKAKLDREFFGKENGRKILRDQKSKEVFKYIGF